MDETEVRKYFDLVQETNVIGKEILNRIADNITLQVLDPIRDIRTIGRMAYEVAEGYAAERQLRHQPGSMDRYYPVNYRPSPYLRAVSEADK